MFQRIPHFAALTLLVAACGAPIKPVSFASSKPPREVLDTAARVMAMDGQSVAMRDDAAGIMESTWVDTGYLWGNMNGPHSEQGVIVRRYKVVVVQGPAGATVNVRIDAKQCPKGGYTVGGTEIRGLCNQMTDVPDTEQQNLNAMAARIDMALQKGQ